MSQYITEVTSLPEILVDIDILKISKCPSVLKKVGGNKTGLR